MATIEQVEKLREKANVSYDEAKNALDMCGNDLLEAMIYLEKQGKVETPKNGGFYSSSNEEKTQTQSEQSREDDWQKGESFGSLARRFFKWCGRMIVKGNVNMFEVHRGDSTIISVPVTVLVLLLIFAFWVVVPLIVIGLFFGCHYFFRGSDFEKTGVNRVMEQAADAADKMKKM